MLQEQIQAVEQKINALDYELNESIEYQKILREELRVLRSTKKSLEQSDEKLKNLKTSDPEELHAESAIFA